MSCTVYTSRRGRLAKVYCTGMSWGDCEVGLVGGWEKSRALGKVGSWGVLVEVGLMGKRKMAPIFDR